MIALVRKWIIDYKELSLFACIAVLSFGFHFCSSSKSADPNSQAETLESFDTLIPKGFSLVPIEVANYETLDSLLGRHGVVDLFVADEKNSSRSQRVASRVKILRAPKNPSHFAVLVADHEVASVMKFPGPFTVSVLNPRAVGTHFEKAPSRRMSRIVYE